MSWNEQLFNYCERGLDPAFWAEPFNAASNLAFLVAAGLSSMRLRRADRDGRPPVPPGSWLQALVALLMVIGAGSFLFHTFATRWALMADVIPITLFIITYLAFALRFMVGLAWSVVVLLLVAFLVASEVGPELACRGGRCLNGSLGYVLPLMALLAMGLALPRKTPHRRILLYAAPVFAVSLVLRTVDRDLCGATDLLGRHRGTHALWHMLNGVTLYLLVDAGIQWRAWAGSGRGDQRHGS